MPLFSIDHIIYYDHPNYDYDDQIAIEGTKLVEANSAEEAEKKLKEEIELIFTQKEKEGKGYNFELEITETKEIKT